MRVKESVKVANDVKRLKRYASVLIIISPDNKDFQVIENKEARLRIIGVIGPSPEYKEAILLEVGYRRNRPYHQAKGFNQKQFGNSNIPFRFKKFSTSKEQYLLVAPIIFKHISEIALAGVLHWKNHYTSIEIDTDHFTCRGKNLHKKVWVREYYRGIIFSVNLNDQFLSADILWAHLRGEKTLSMLRGKGCYIDKGINTFFEKNAFRFPFSNSETARHIRNETVSILHPILRKKLIAFLPEGRKTKLFPELLDILELDQWSPEEEILKKILPRPLARTQDIQVRITRGPAGLGQEEGPENILTFEVLPFVGRESEPDFYELKKQAGLLVEEEKRGKFDDDRIPF